MNILGIEYIGLLARVFHPGRKDKLLRNNNLRDKFAFNVDRIDSSIEQHNVSAALNCIQ